MRSSFAKEDIIEGFSILCFKSFDNLKAFENVGTTNYKTLRNCVSSPSSSSGDETTIDETSPKAKHKMTRQKLTKSARDLKLQLSSSICVLKKKSIEEGGDSTDTVDDDDDDENNLVICEELNEILAANEFTSSMETNSQLKNIPYNESEHKNNDIKSIKPDMGILQTAENSENICLNVEKGKRHIDEGFDTESVLAKHIKREESTIITENEKTIDEELSVEAFVKLEKFNKTEEILTSIASISTTASPLIEIKKEKLSKLRVQTPDDCVILDSGNESNHSITPNYSYHQRSYKKYTNLFVAGGKELILTHNTQLSGCSRTDLIYKKTLTTKDKLSWKDE